MWTFVVSNDSGKISRACDEISDLLSLRHRRASRSSCGPLVGIWSIPGIDSDVAADLQQQGTEALGLGRLIEATAMGHVWTLCCFDGEPPCRLTLLNALRNTSSATRAGTSFAPVFRSDLTRAELDSELSSLRGGLGVSISQPVLQDGETGRLILPTDYSS